MFILTGSLEDLLTGGMTVEQIKVAHERALFEIDNEYVRERRKRERELVELERRHIKKTRPLMVRLIDLQEYEKKQ